MPHIDLNCDLGESFGAYTIGMDEKVIPFITSANVACGFHAGDPLVMQRTVALCKQSGAAVGAHPGFPDLQGFGRRQMKLTPAEAKACVQYQIGALKAFCDAAGVPLHHVSGGIRWKRQPLHGISRPMCLCLPAMLPGQLPDTGLPSLF